MKMSYIEELKIGFIQTTLDNEIAWSKKRIYPFRIKRRCEDYLIQEIKKGFHKLHNHARKPDIIILPELSVPIGYCNGLYNLAKNINSIVIGGLDFVVDANTHEVKNKAIVYIPSSWDNQAGKSSFCASYIIGKKHPARIEDEYIKDVNRFRHTDYQFAPDTNIYIFKSIYYGNIGIAICADFFDIERFTVYKGRVQHIFILAYNIDTNSFFAIAEAVSRLVFCNVVIVNTGKFGDTCAYSPYRNSYDRIIYRTQGKDLFATQVFKLPVKDLVNAQKNEDNNKLFKSRPPGYQALF